MKRTSPFRTSRGDAAHGNKVPRAEVRTLVSSFGREVTTIVFVCIDLAKNVFAVHGMSAAGAVQLRRAGIARQAQ